MVWLYWKLVRLSRQSRLLYLILVTALVLALVLAFLLVFLNQASRLSFWIENDVDPPIVLDLDRDFIQLVHTDPMLYKGPIVKSWPPEKSRSLTKYIKGSKNILHAMLNLT